MSSTSSSGGHFHRRWGSAGSSSRASPHLAGASSATVEPSTYGTSWNSVRWTKPATPGYRSQSSRIAASFERDKPAASSYYLSSSSVPRRSEVSSTADKYLNTAARTAANLASLGPSVSTRASRFDGASAASDKYRSEARDLISKYTSKERPSTTSAAGGSGGYYSRHFEPQKLPVSQEPFTSPRTTVPYASATLDSSRDRENSASRYSVGRDYGTTSAAYRKSASTTPTRSTPGRYSEARSVTSPGPSSAAAGGSGSSLHVLKQERPWRQRMTESARVRAMHGEDVSASYLASRASRQKSIGRGETDDLTSSISALRNYVSQPAGYRSRTSSIESRINGRLSRDHSRESIGVPMSASLVVAARRELAEVEDGAKAMSRSYSPVRSKEPLIPRFPTADIAEMMDKRASSSDSRRGVAAAPINDPIEEEEVRDRDRDRKRSVRERSEARILSRQSSVGGITGSGGGGDASSGEDLERERGEARRKRRASRVRRSRTRDLQLSGMENGERTPSRQDGEVDAPLSPGPLSPRMGGKLSRSASATKKMVPTKKQSIKSPCLVEVGGPSTAVITTPLTSPIALAAPAALAAAAAAPLSPAAAAPPLSPAAANMPEDESQYNAVTSFKPAFKPKVKPLKPVPGTWKKEDEKEENISKNKTIERPPARLEATLTWTGPLWASAKKALRVKPKATIKKEREAVKEAQKEAEKRAKEEAKLKKEEEKRLKKEEEKRKKEKIEEARCSVTLECPKERGSVAVEATRAQPMRASVRSAKLREKRPKPVEISIEKSLKSGRKEATARCERQFKTRSAPAASTVSLQCASSTSSECALRQTIDKRAKEAERQAAAKVHVISGPIDGVTMSRVRLRVRAALKEERKRQSLPAFPSALDIDDILEKDEKAKARRATVLIEEDDEGSERVDEGLSRSNSERDSRAAIILNEMRVQHEHERRRASQDFLVGDATTGPLVLPDKSILEEYVKRKRGQLEELRSAAPFTSASLEAAAGLTDSFRSESPADSVCSDLLPAPEVRIYAHSPRHSAHITSSSRRSSCSLLDDASSATPTGMLDTLGPLLQHQTSSPQPGSAAAAGYTSNPSGFLRHGGRAVTLTAKPLPFDTPKTPFEATLQHQANRIRRGNLVHQDSNNSTTSLDEQAMQRSGLVNSFNASIAAASAPRSHERYAAHLPLRSGELSGRTSAASMDSVQSGTLDAASKHVDNMIDQARFKHQAHRSKFKEAIDYLDNIFEDLKKEVDPSAPSTANGSPGPSRVQQQHQRKTSSTSLNGAEHLHQLGGSAAVKQALQREAAAKAAVRGGGAAAAAAPAAANGMSYSQSSSNSLPNRSQRHRQQPQQQPIVTKEPSPVEMSIRPVQKSQQPEDYEVSETLVLPRKTDKLDFTRRWLQDDLAGFTKAPPPMMGAGEGPSMYSDPDEHSLGSCSAEVAAINNTKQKRRRESKPKTEKVQPQQLQQQPAAEKKLAPYRPQPVYGQPSSNGARFPLEVADSSSLAVPSGNSLSRVASYDRLSERLQSRHSEVWRAASQEPYQTLGSVRSEDGGARPSPSSSSAFHPAAAAAAGAATSAAAGFQRNSSMRGSIKSLPDASLVVKHRQPQQHAAQHYYPDQARDPAGAMDALVAELELNTDQNGNATDKRRSFPTVGGMNGGGGRQMQQPLQHLLQQPHGQRVVPAASAPAHQVQQLQQQQQRYAAPQQYQQPQPQQPYSSQSSSSRHVQQPQPYSKQQPQQQQQHPPSNGMHYPSRVPATAAAVAPSNTGSLGRSKNGHAHQFPDASALDEVTSMLQAVSEFPAERPKKSNGSSQQPQQPFAAAAASAAASNGSSRPFDTINQERINPSRVEAIQNMFESRRASGPSQQQQHGYDWRSGGKKHSREEDYDTSEYSNPPMRGVQQPQPKPSPPPHRAAAAAATAAGVRHSPSGYHQHQSYPHQQQLQHQQQQPYQPYQQQLQQHHHHSNHHQQQQQQQGGAPLGRNGSAGSSQNGGYYSSNSSCAVGPTTSSYQQSGGSASARRQSIGSRAPSVEDEDDGFYDNIGIYGSMNEDSRRFSRGSELGDTVSMSSARLPPSASNKPTRIGSFLSKIGARSGGSALVRQPGTAASLVSLNKVALDSPAHHHHQHQQQNRATLTKSSSLSNDPWRKEVLLEGANGKRGSSTGLGARLKNSLFGSKKRLN